MPKIFTDENRDEIRMKLLNNGFKMLKKGGLSAVNIDKLTEETYIAKGTFYNLFENKSEFMYHMMIHERNRAKEKLFSYLNSSGKLTRDSLHDYLKWLSAENPNVFAFLNDAENLSINSLNHMGLIAVFTLMGASYPFYPIVIAVRTFLALVFMMPAHHATLLESVIIIFTTPKNPTCYIVHFIFVNFYQFIIHFLVLTHMPPFLS